MVTKHLKSIFVFNANGYLELQSGKVLTHFLEKNEKCSVWDIVDRDKGEEKQKFKKKYINKKLEFSLFLASIQV